MSTLLSTLPGDIPGLLRRGSPVCYYSQRRDEMLTDVASRIDEGYAYGPDQACADLSLDLSDETGRAHVYAWLTRQEAAHLNLRDDAAARRVFVQARDFEPMTATEIDTLARFALRVAGRAS